MVEYTFDEARTLLGKNLDNAIANLKRFVNTHYPIFEFLGPGHIFFKGLNNNNRGKPSQSL